MRRRASLLLASGHPDADRYPIRELIFESDIVSRRQRTMQASEAVWMQMVVASVFDKKAAERFGRLVRTAIEAE